MKKLNILLITSDQQHFDTIGAFNSEIETPNLDRLVNEGTTFKRAYCPNPTCTPSRASIVTGMYPSQHGAWGLGTKLLEDRPTVGEEFLKNGYETVLIGKGHLQPTKQTEAYTSLESYPLVSDLDFWKDFDEMFYGFKHVEFARNHTNEHLVGQHYALWMEEKGLSNWRDYFLPPTGNMDPDQKYKWDIPEAYHYNAWIKERSNAWIERFAKRDEPFFLWSSFLDPHPPYLVPEPWCSMYDPDKLTIPKLKLNEHENNPPHFQKTQEEKPDFSEFQETGYGVHGYHSHLGVNEEDHKESVATYYGMISMMDKYIGDILDKLDELKIADETVIVFTTDHGHFFGQHGLHHKGGFHYEDLIKIPFIVRYPGKVPAGKQSDALQSLVDLAPTFLDLSNIKVPNYMTGVSQKDVWLKQEEKKRDHIICEFHPEPTTVHQKTYVNDRYKITVYRNQVYGELFDLKEDPLEYRNLWDLEEYKDLKRSLLLKYIWAELQNEPMAMPRVTGA